ncbi:caspase family protein [Streptomyces purpureus]|uniref:Peptidase C14 caspase domain-containing protein n=1 Tax=Streptomyces purpureus TaxID=1951 RepID=A0A918GVV9_9ACTN|nr:caspase family protein [Streptomyces purpureus]GGT12683.1 hypothetical protein GCM10014713_01370 [Streptomyces purpureus]
MARFTVQLDENAEEARTHALVIGVGAYRHLIGGPQEVANPHGLRQLSSPPVSAREFATWLLTEYNEPNKPLGSLALLLSEAVPGPFRDPRTGREHSVEEATIDNVDAAVREWKARADLRDDDRIVFYFCGHGVSLGNDMSLLASDVFADQESPLNGALNFTELWRGLIRCRAAEQVFFVDACRAGPDRLIRQAGGGFAGRVPIAGQERPAGFAPREYAVYYATLDGEGSHARTGQVSLFTDALLRSLAGSGSENTDDDVWRVSTPALQLAIGRFMKEPQFAGEFAGVQVPVSPESFDFGLHELTGDPVVPVYIGCSPREDNEFAEFVCRGERMPELRRALADIDASDPTAEWPLDLPLGEYAVEARFDGRPPRGSRLGVRPPLRRIGLKP